MEKTYRRYGWMSSSRTIIKKLPNGSFFVFSAVRERTLEEWFDHKRKADFRTPVSLANERRGGKANPCARTNIKKKSWYFPFFVLNITAQNRLYSPFFEPCCNYRCNTVYFPCKIQLYVINCQKNTGIYEDEKSWNYMLNNFTT